MRAIMKGEGEAVSVTSSLSTQMRAAREVERAPTPATSGFPHWMRRIAMGLLGTSPQGGRASRRMRAATLVERCLSMRMRASWKTLSAPSEVLRASVKVSRQMVKLSRPIVSDACGCVSDGNAAWSSATRCERRPHQDEGCHRRCEARPPGDEPRPPQCEARQPAVRSANPVVSLVRQVVGDVSVTVGLVRSIVRRGNASVSEGTGRVSFAPGRVDEPRWRSQILERINGWRWPPRCGDATATMAGVHSLRQGGGRDPGGVASMPKSAAANW